jgi:hypothetical protein
MHKKVYLIIVSLGIIILLNSQIFSEIGNVPKTNKNSIEVVKTGKDKKKCESLKNRFQSKVDCRENCVEIFKTYIEQQGCMSTCDSCLSHLPY